MKKTTRLILTAVFIALWAFPVCLLLEFFASRQVPRMQKNYEKVQKEIQARESQRNAQFPKLKKPASTALQDSLAVSLQWGPRIAQMSGEERQELVSLQEMFLGIYTPQAVFEQGYTASTLMQAFSIPQKPGENVDLFSFVQKDIQQAVHERIGQVVQKGEALSWQFKRAPEQGGLWYTVSLYPMQDTTAETTSVAILLRAALWNPDISTSKLDAIWEIPWFRFKPNFAQSGYFFTNAFGFRDEPVQLPKPTDTFRIACIGGSATVEGRSNSETYPNLLEEMLQDSFPKRNFDVINCGVHAMDSYKEKLRFFDYLALEPDLCITYDGQNEFQGALLNRWDLAYPAWKQKLLRSHFLRSYFNPWLLPSKKEIQNCFDSYTFAHVHAMLPILRRKGIALAMCSFAYPDLKDATPEEQDFFNWSLTRFWPDRKLSFASYCRLLDIYNQQMQFFCEKNAVCYIPVAEELRGGTRYFIDICHMTQEGIERKAEIIHNYLQERISRSEF